MFKSIRTSLLIIRGKYFLTLKRKKMTINHIHNQINAAMEIKIIEVEYYIGGRKKLSKMIRIANKFSFTTYNGLELEKH